MKPTCQSKHNIHVTYQEISQINKTVINKIRVRLFWNSLSQLNVNKEPSIVDNQYTVET